MPPQENSHSDCLTEEQTNIDEVFASRVEIPQKAVVKQVGDVELLIVARVIGHHPDGIAYNKIWEVTDFDTSVLNSTLQRLEEAGLIEASGNIGSAIEMFFPADVGRG